MGVQDLNEPARVYKGGTGSDSDSDSLQIKRVASDATTAKEENSQRKLAQGCSYLIMLLIKIQLKNTFNT